MPIEFENLSDLSSKPHMLEAFRNHLETERSTENLDFHEAVAAFKAKASDQGVSEDELRQAAKELFDTYVDASQEVNFDFDAPQNRQVNLKATAYDPIVEQMQSIASANRSEMSTMFDAADREIVLLMEADSMRRFQGKVNDSIQPAEDRIQQLRARAEQLQNSRWERFKAAFSGGAKKELDGIVQKIDQANMEIMQKTDPQRFETIQREKEKMAEKMGQKQDRLTPNVDEFNKVKSAVTSLALENSVGGDMSRKERAALEKLADKAPGMVASMQAAEKIGQEKEALTKSVSVGEALKGRIGNAPTQGQRGPRVGGV